MLAGFVVPHGHFRLFHGDPAADSQHAAPNDQFPLSLNPQRTAAAPTDLHLREFAQLEVQVKALQLQAAQHASPLAMGAAVAPALAECLLFYSRLFSVESFPWPDFLTAVFTKLAEHFASSDNEIVRSAVLRVFQRAKAHVAQINDASKLLAHLSTPLSDTTSASTRALTLQLLATMPSAIQTNTTMHAKILSHLLAGNRDERLAASEAARALLPLSPSFRHEVLTMTQASSSITTCCLLPGAVSNSVEAQQAWTHCAELYERLADDKSAVACVRAMTALTAIYPVELVGIHGQLLHHVLDHDPRALVRNMAVLSTQKLVTEASSENEQLERVLEGVFARMTQSPTSRDMRLKLSTLLLLEKWSSVASELGKDAKVLLHDAKTWVSMDDERFGQTYVYILANMARQQLPGASQEQAQQLVEQLLHLLHPTDSRVSSGTWNRALDAVAELAKEFPKLLSAYVTSWLVELLSVSSSINDNTMTTAVLRVLSAQLQPPSASVVKAQLPALLEALKHLKPTDASLLQALSTTFFHWTDELPDSSSDQILVEFEAQLLAPELYESHANRYDLATLAMRRGRFTLAAQLLAPVAAQADSECFGGWLLALQALCEAEADVLTNQAVELSSLHALARAKTLLQAARTSSFRFELQSHFVSLRLEWLQLVQRTQQLAGEAAFTGVSGSAAGREGHLAGLLRSLGAKFTSLRASLLGADQRDLDALQTHAQSSYLLAAALEGFLLLHPVENVEFPLLDECCRSPWTQLGSSAQTKLERLSRLPVARQASLGARVLQQLLSAVCAVPCAVPRLVFRSRVRAENRLHSSAQFLTYSENAAFTAKPRSRAQLGVPLGTDFTSLLKGVLALSRRTQSYWQEQTEALEVEVLVCLADAATGVSGVDFSIYEAKQIPESTAVQCRVRVRLDLAWDRGVEAGGDGQTMLYVPFETPVHVKAASLRAKGSFMLLARLTLLDRRGERWPLAATGCRRGFIVY